MTKEEREKAYNISLEELKDKDDAILEKSFELLKETDDRNLEAMKNIDSKASLLLVIYVGIFTIFACIIKTWEFSTLFQSIFFLSAFGLTIISYIVSMILLVATIAVRFSYSYTTQSICLKDIKIYRHWLINQICIKGTHCKHRIETAQKKARIYKVGSIFLVVSVCLTLILATFAVCVGLM